jgi:2-methylcitrate dehydratase PrpD
MKRREFLKDIVTAGAAITVAAGVGPLVKNGYAGEKKDEKPCGKSPKDAGAKRGGKMEKDAISTFADYIVGTSYGDIPRPVVEATKMRVADTVAALFPGSTAIETRILMEYFAGRAGRGESTVFNHGVKVPVEEAALINATMARCLDFDDVHEPSSMHVHVFTVPVAFAVAETLGDVTGKDFLTAVILGGDVMLRIGLANTIPTAVSGMNASYQLANFGAVATAGKLLGLDRAGMINAMGIAYAQLCGNSQCLTEGTMTTRFTGGVAARNGVFSAFLSKKGLTGVKEVLEGKFGYFPVYQQNKYDRETLFDGLGKTFHNAATTMKIYPCCMHTHSAIYALDLIMKEDKVPKNDIAAINVQLNQQGYNLTCLGKDQKRRPASIPEAQFSTAFVLGNLVAKGSVFLDDFTEKTIIDPDRLRFAALVDSKISPEFEATAAKDISPATVEVVLKDGKRFQRTVKIRRGHPDNPLSVGEVKEKLRRCSEFAFRRPDENSLNSVFGKLVDLENRRPNEIMQDLSGGKLRS